MSHTVTQVKFVRAELLKTSRIATSHATTHRTCMQDEQPNVVNTELLSRVAPDGRSSAGYEHSLAVEPDLPKQRTLMKHPNPYTYSVEFH